MKTKEEIFHNICKPYGGFVNVINRVGGSTVMMLVDKAMQEYSDQTNAKLVEENELKNAAYSELGNKYSHLLVELSKANERSSKLEGHLRTLVGMYCGGDDILLKQIKETLTPKQHG